MLVIGPRTRTVRPYRGRAVCAKMRKGLIPWQYFVEIATFMIVIFPWLRYNDGIRNLNTVRK